MKAKAVVFTDKLQVSFQDIEIPELGSDQVLIEVEYSWISIGTESSFLRKERISGEVMYKEGDPSPFPHVPGYQKVGVIQAVGADVHGLAVGERVFTSLSMVMGMVFPYAGHVSLAVTHASQVWKLPEGCDPITYSGLVLTQVGYNCGFRAPIQPGDFAVVIGDGLVGQWTAQTLLHRGARVAVLGRHDERLGYLPKTIHGINTQKKSASDALSAYNGIKIVVDTVGDMATFRKIQPMMKYNSHFISAGFLGETGVLNIQSLREQEITLHCPSGWDKARMDATLEGIEEGWLKTEPLITHRFPAEQADEAWKLILDKKKMCLGVVLVWKGSRLV
ncbi:alcohol dehydrogenase catalytic domain-containing protein [Paenibacillus eucommiae]|uniref:2-desacetyl-2-hydroxyethyl bacteriochlorophyllide A dehydrogenase n=1 Tax=Paenibacillus eucommiae TaxID=1355755 RepID=A0ABS4ILN7_9BACL|nr:alcohol dehydrogenase catalytic domain-containing protein [Paenibacillus eucommiae]MBP1988476.1 2-desacetyl-2-hydroxyethyl bacteriochlorophyllide A dehydrogenase [Paenibacillus eucommiae]